MRVPRAAAMAVIWPCRVAMVWPCKKKLGISGVARGRVRSGHGGGGAPKRHGGTSRLLCSLELTLRVRLSLAAAVLAGRRGAGLLGRPKARQVLQQGGVAVGPFHLNVRAARSLRAALSVADPGNRLLCHGLPIRSLAVHLVELLAHAIVIGHHARSSVVHLLEGLHEDAERTRPRPVVAGLLPCVLEDRELVRVVRDPRL
mmetsp:Transcript_58336/g.188936  ORF Transcript_58336/g.188936 Transcript_58336/m.188936 type:complete len:201 (+) Transcript_58336:283-885(+)